ncbi:pyruvate ferredoxin oxidoreductase [Candidatus Bathyarchaeota archaeon]|nr:pyruvate ferredoxin oxidoreductase [Candidatus Bathyarchaeota archaeon]
MRKITALTGTHAVAHAMRQINPDVLAAYPITPQTAIVQKFSEFVADGLVDTEFIAVESEHSAMSACVGASMAGGRAMTATAANGLALMWEIVYIASSTRLPIVMGVVNRALSAPINIHCDHSDSMGTRDAGWIQLYSEDVQEAYDNTIQAVRIAEHDEVLLPVMVCQDGFLTGHDLERVELLDDNEVKAFVGTRKAKYSLLDLDNPITVGPLDLYDYYFEHKRQQAEAIEKSRKVIDEIAKEYEALTGRSYGKVSAYRLDDAEIATIVMGSTSGTCRVIVDHLRDDGVKAGTLKIRCFRPFPWKEIADALRGVSAVAVLDRSASFGGLGGPIFTEVRSGLYNSESRPHIVDYIYGLGGRAVRNSNIESVYSNLSRIIETREIGMTVNYLGVRE